MEDEKAILVQLGAAGTFGHFYGNDPELRGLDTIKPGSPPAHLVLTLDGRDPLLDRLSLGSYSRFRFVYPYHYGNKEFTYKQIDDRIEFLNSESMFFEPDFPYPGFPNPFTRVSAKLCLVRFPTAIVDDYPPTDISHPQAAIYLGRNQTTIQDHHINCPQCQRETRLIGRVPNQARGAVEKIWDNDWVFSLFFYCDSCGITIAFNECD